MGDLKVGETFEDRVYIVDSSGAAKTGLAPTCTIIDESGNRTAGTVAEMANGWYKVTDFTPDAAGTWCLEWAVTGAYIIQYPNKLFKVEGGLLADIHTLLGSPAGASVSADLAAINTALTYQYQPMITFNQVTPTQDAWYTVLDTTTNVIIHGVVVLIGTTNETVQLRLTIDGQELAPSVAAVAGTYYSLYVDGRNAPLVIAAFGAVQTLGISGRSVKVEVRKTTANGTGTLSARVVYGKR